MQVFVHGKVWEFLGKVAEDPGVNERCGLLVGRAGDEIEVTDVHEVENVKASPVEFELNPSEVLRIFESVEDAGLEIVGVWHTHPGGRATPSLKDVDGMRNFPGLWVIIARGEVKWYLAGEKGFEAVEITEVPHSDPSSSPSS